MIAIVPSCGIHDDCHSAKQCESMMIAIVLSSGIHDDCHSAKQWNP